MNKESWLILAEAFIADQDAWNEMTEALHKIAHKARTDFDFRDLPYNAEQLVGGVASVLGEEFSYWYYDCKKSFSKYNKWVTLQDGTHPNIHSLEELYDQGKNEEAGLVLCG